MRENREQTYALQKYTENDYKFSSFSNCVIIRDTI